MDVIQLARELGKAIQQEACYADFVNAKEANDADEALQNAIGEFNLKRLSINNEMSSPNKDEEKLKQLNNELREMYQAIMENESMVRYNEAKQGIDKILGDVNTILMMSVNGEDPDKIDLEACTGNCASCGGSCH